MSSTYGIVCISSLAYVLLLFLFLHFYVILFLPPPLNYKLVVILPEMFSSNQCITVGPYFIIKAMDIDEHIKRYTYL